MYMKLVWKLQRNITICVCIVKYDHTYILHIIIITLYTWIKTCSHFPMWNLMFESIEDTTLNILKLFLYLTFVRSSTVHLQCTCHLLLYCTGPIISMKTSYDVCSTRGPSEFLSPSRLHFKHVIACMCRVTFFLQKFCILLVNLFSLIWLSVVFGTEICFLQAQGYVASFYD